MDTMLVVAYTWRQPARAVPGTPRFTRPPTYRENAALTDDLLPIDPSRFNHPLAETVAWEPMDAEGAGFCTYRLREISPTRYELRMTPIMSFLHGGNFVVGLVCFVIVGALLVDRPDDMHIAWALIPLVAGIVFAGLGGLMFFQGRKTVAFDRQLNRYWDDRYRKLDGRFRPNEQHEAPLDQIAALQVLARWESEGDSNYYTYELNLVLHGSERLAVTSHGGLRQLREDAARLARFLDVPLWDATDQQFTPTLAGYLGGWFRKFRSGKQQCVK